MRCDATDGHGRNHTTQQRVSQPRCGLSPPLLRPLATFNYAEMYTLAAGSRLTGALLLSGGGAVHGTDRRSVGGVARLQLGWVTVFGRVYQLGQLSFASLRGRLIEYQLRLG